MLTDEIYLQDIHSISSVLKAYFRELPNPLFTYQLYSKFAVSPQGLLAKFDVVMVLDESFSGQDTTAILK